MMVFNPLGIYGHSNKRKPQKIDRIHVLFWLLWLMAFDIIAAYNKNTQNTVVGYAGFNYNKEHISNIS
ncbi:hypothetical protein CEP53_005307 [Fusarium sp. AF-6]|nr:hypothetical protein CEP53_005307 [Fusarium sp. AF-6]